jgi:hypothetical protein
MKNNVRHAIVFHRAKHVARHGPTDSFMEPIVRFCVEEEAPIPQVLENVFYQTNHITDEWIHNQVPWEHLLSRVLLTQPPYRSTSVGDVVLIAHRGIDTYYRCEPAGWLAIPESEVNLDGSRNRRDQNNEC